MKRLSAALLAASILLGLPGSAEAQRRIDVQRFDPAPQATGFVRVPNAEIPETPSWSVSLSANWAWRALSLGVPETYALNGSILEHLFGFNLNGSIGLTDRFELGLSVPFYQALIFNNDNAGLITGAAGSEIPNRTGGFGDITLSGGFQLMRADDLGIGLQLAPRILFPTGEGRKLLGTGSLGLGGGLVIGRGIGPVNVSGTVGFQWNTRGAAESVGILLTDDELYWGLGVSFDQPIQTGRMTVNASGRRVPLTKPLTIGLEWTGSTVLRWDICGVDRATLPSQDQSKQCIFERVLTPMELGVSAAYRLDNGPALTGGIAMGLGQGFGAPQLRVFLRVGIGGPISGDADLDQVVGRADQCPKLEEDWDAFETEYLRLRDRGLLDPEATEIIIDGCPETDYDNDGVLDQVDACPAEPEVFNGFNDADGCPDADVDCDLVGEADGSGDACVPAFVVSRPRQCWILQDMRAHFVESPQHLSEEAFHRELLVVQERLKAELPEWVITEVGIIRGDDTLTDTDKRERLARIRDGIVLIPEQDSYQALHDPLSLRDALYLDVYLANPKQLTSVIRGVLDNMRVPMEDLDGFQDGDGCPDPDNDGDGITDAPERWDECPDEAEDMDGWADDDGCPDPDNDGDGIADTDDLCPDEAETANGLPDDPPVQEWVPYFEFNERGEWAENPRKGTWVDVPDADGCPDPGLVEFVTEGDQAYIRLNERVEFGGYTDRIQPWSYDVLDAIITVLDTYPRIRLVDIQAHTDPIGDPAKSMRVSEARARTIRDYMIMRGIDPARLISTGFGDTQPETGKPRNRVEFEVLAVE